MYNLDFSDLILLVGTNPLPNYVTAQYFMEHNPNLNTIWLMHSKSSGSQQGTKELADNIIEVLSGKNIKPVSFRIIELSDISCSMQIEEDIIKSGIINELNKDRRKAHLNYTGGTKTMAVHVYRVLGEKLADRCSYSYLDARDFRIKMDGIRGALTGDLRLKVGVTLDNLIQLHGYTKLGRNAGDEAIWNTVVSEFGKLIDEGQLSAYLDWVKKFLEPVYWEAGGLLSTAQKYINHNMNRLKAKDEEEMARRIREDYNAKTPDPIKRLLQALQERYPMLEGETLWVPASKNKNNYSNKAEKPVDFLHGKWLEHYVAQVLKETMPSAAGGRDIPLETNWQICKKDGGKDFELDVILVNGYQVCGISCTTSRKDSECKLKGFEVLHRVNQMGGEEAKAVLITCLPEVAKKNGKDVSILENMAKDLKAISGSTDEKLLVLGIEDLKAETMSKKIFRHVFGEE